MTEAELTHEVMMHAGRLGLLIHHCADSRRCHGNRGLPDLIIAAPGGILLAELKGADGETSPDQDRWLHALHRAGVSYAVWRPADWESGWIRTQLEIMAG